MPIAETCLLCGLSLSFIPNARHPHGGYYLHRHPLEDAPDSPPWQRYRAAGYGHDAVPALENPAVASEPVK